MTRPLKKHATYADLCAVPENFVAEIIGGDLYSFPRPASRHAFVTSVLGSELMGPFHRGKSGPGGWWFVDEPELHFAADVLVPDIAGWRRESMPTFPDAAYITLAPDWICEVLSPSTEQIDRSKKLEIYAREQVRHAWLIDPRLRMLEVLRLVSERWSLVATHEGGASVRAGPFDAIELPLSALWPD